MWRRNRVVALLVVVAGLFFLWVDRTQLARPNLRDIQFVTALLYSPAGLVLAGVFLYNRWRNRIEITEVGLRVRTLLSTVTIGFDAIRQVRVQPLEKAYSGAAAKRLA